MIELREMSEGDLPAVAALEKRCFTVPWSEESLRYAILSPQTACLALTEDGEVVGYTMFACLFEDCEILNIAVSPEKRRRGFGRLLLATLLRAARDAGCERVFLEVREGNAPARALYEGAGFRPCGRRKDYYRLPTEDAILMGVLLPKKEEEPK